MVDHKMLLEIVKELGGIENIERVSNCMTRLRVIVKEENLANRESIKKIDGVLGIVGKKDSIQIILGPGNAEQARKEVSTLLSNYQAACEKKPKDKVEAFNEKKKHRNEIFTFISQVFTPLIPALAGTGLLFGLMKIFQYIYIYFDVALFNPAAIADGGSVFMAALNVIAGSFFSIMNIAVAAQATKVLGGNQFVGMAVGGIVGNVGLLNGVSMGFMDLSFRSGMGGTLAALFGGMLVAIVEKKVSKVTPNALKVHFPSLFAVAISGLAVLFIIQPISGMLADGITSVVLWLVENAGALGGAIISGTFLPLVALGIHHIFTPIHTTLLQEVGHTCLVGFSSMAGAGLAGVALGLYLKYRTNKEYNKLKTAVLGNIPTQLLGISEPMIYGVSLPLWRPFIAANLGGAVGGFVLGLFPGQGAEAMNVSGLLGMLVNTEPLGYLLGYCSAVAAAAFFTYTMGVKKENLAIFMGKETQAE